MKPLTRKLWTHQDRHQGDRWRLYTAVSHVVEAKHVLYPGSFVDIAASFVWPSVTYIDSIDRARRFFDDREGVQELVAEHDPPTPNPDITFVHGDYTGDLGLPEGHFDLLISLYAGFVSEHCTRYLRKGGTLLVNPSHGDVAMAALDPRYQLHGVIASDRGEYRITTNDLDRYLVPKNPDIEITADLLHSLNRGIAYTRSPFAYLFRLID